MWNQYHPSARALWLILLFLVGCSPVLPTLPPTATIQPPIVSATPIIPTILPIDSPSSTVIPTLTPLRPTDTFIEPTATKNPRPGNFPLKTATSTPTIPYTPTLDPASIKTATPAPAAQCHTIGNSPAPTPGFFELFDTREQTIYTPEDVVDYLNLYGPAPLVKGYKKLIIPKPYTTDFLYQDLTNDGIAEVVMALQIGVVGSKLYIFGCLNERYQLLFAQSAIEDIFLNSYGVEVIKDGNRNGIPEVTFWTGANTQGGSGYQMYEWNGTSFEKLLIAGETEYFAFPNCDMLVEGNGRVFYQDIDNDHIDEFVISQGTPIWSTYSSGLPFRNVTRYHKWDGHHYIFLKQEYDPPEFRFQAVQDGDRFSLLKEDDRALDSYQQAVFSDKLKSWSEEYRQYLQAVYNLRDSEEPTPTPPAPDLNEYPNLAAYARYRIMLIHLLNNHLPEAQIVYDTLQKLFPEGKAGHPYTEMAQVFWDEYQNSKDMGQACHAAIHYAKDHPEETLSYLGTTDNGKTGFGWQSTYYTPESICPFQ